LRTYCTCIITILSNTLVYRVSTPYFHLGALPSFDPHSPEHDYDCSMHIRLTSLHLFNFGLRSAIATIDAVTMTQVCL